MLNGTTPFGVIETYHRVANEGTANQNVADLVYTTNPRQIDTNHLLSAGSFAVAPHYRSTLRAVSTIDGAIQTTMDGRNAFWGATNGPSGNTHLPFFEIPRQAMLSLAAFQNADLASSTYSPSNQFGNSWASPYLEANRVGQLYKKYITTGQPLYDTSYLANEALWDGYFFSGAAPRLEPSSATQVSAPWSNDIANKTSTLNQVVKDFIADPDANPLGNSRWVEPKC